MDNKSEESVSSEGMLSGGGSRGKWGAAVVLDVRHPAIGTIVVSNMQERSKSDDTTHKCGF